MYEISKEFEFDYGHRVWTQDLNKDFSLTSTNACRHLHGHRGKIVVSLKGGNLGEDGMLTDFNNLNIFKKWVNDYLDHKFLFHLQDPLFKAELEMLKNLLGIFDSSVYDYLESKGEGYYVINQTILEMIKSKAEEDSFYLCLLDKWKGLTILDFVPTSENLSKWVFDIVTEMLKPLLKDSEVKVSKIDFYETPKSKSTFERNL
jgi:6-pyruvoyltetrahydropterin/6-carboxytetrahydropterin synthase